MKLVRPSAAAAKPHEEVDVTQIFFQLQELYAEVFAFQFGSQVFFYRPLGRLEYKQLVTDDRVTALQKEDIICEACTLWPENFDFEDCEAGIPTMLTREILKSSYLDSEDSRRAVTEYYRSEMFDLDNQIICIINEAFPECSIEDIESWGVAKTAKYLSMAEWKLQNLRGLRMVFDPIQGPGEAQQAPPAPKAQPKKAVTEELTAEEPKKTMNGKKKEKLTPEKLAELQRKFPEIDWANDTVASGGIDAMQDSIDVTSPALRPGR